MKKIHQISAALLLTITVISCTNQSGPGFTTKADSINFVKAVLVEYPQLCNQAVPIDTLTPSRGMKPIDWDTVTAYKNYYDKDPLLKDPLGAPYHGFTVNAKGYSALIARPEIRGLYLRLGRKPGSGAYTIMVLGTDAKGNVIQTSSTAYADSTVGALTPTNYDQLEPCPANCPTNIDSIPLP